jgi:branched-chain amino acid transport system permease protein
VNIVERFGGVFLLPVAIAIIAFVLIGAPSSWLTLTVAGLAMGMMLFLMASGLSLVFGLMDVLNFGHSAFVSFGAFVAASVLAYFGGWLGSDSIFLNIMALVFAIAAAIVFGAALGWFFERVIVKPVYSDHLRQILITMGALIVAEQLILATWGGTPTNVLRPAFLEGTIIVGGSSLEVYRLFAFIVGAVVYAGLYLLLNRTRMGLLIRAGVENREMVEALGFKIDRLFIGVFMLGSALAAMGGAMWAGYDAHHPRARGRDDGHRVHRRHHRRPRVDPGHAPGCDHGGADAELRGLPRAETGAGVQHAPDDGDPAVAALRPRPGGEVRRGP